MSYEHLLAGILGGFTSTLVLHPLDLLKVRFAVSDGQSNLKKNYTNVRNAFKTIVKEEGYRGLYKGVAPNCLGAGTAWGLYFLFYNAIKKHMQEKYHGQKVNLAMSETMAAAACAGALTTTITNPIWVVKTRLCLQYGNQPTIETASTTIEGTRGSVVNGSKQTTNAINNILPENKRYSGTWDAFKKVYKYEGISGLYRGFIPGLLGVSHGAVQLVVYEELKKHYLTKLKKKPKDEKLTTGQYLACAALSKLVAASLTYPYQVIRARLQDQHVNYDGVKDVITKTWRYESYRGFYKGFLSYLMHVTPNICIVFIIVETVTGSFN